MYSVYPAGEKYSYNYTAVMQLATSPDVVYTLTGGSDEIIAADDFFWDAAYLDFQPSEIGQYSLTLKFTRDAEKAVVMYPVVYLYEKNVE